MKHLIRIYLPLITILTLAQPVHAEIPEQVEETIRKALQPLMRGGDIDQIRPSEIPGIFEVVIGSNLYYATHDGRYLINGSLLDLHSGRNVSEIKRSGLRMDVINGLGKEQMIIFPAEKAKHTITVFTDLDCPYCRLMHSKIKDYNDRGISVRYLLYPRDVVGSASYNKSVSVWCAKNRKQVFTSANAGNAVKSATCDNPVTSIMALGKQMGVGGTPTIFLESGDKLPGYVPPEELAPKLDQFKKLQTETAKAE